MKLENICTNKMMMLVVLIIAFLLVVFANNRNTTSDPRGTLLVTESILNHFTIKLDHYGEETLRDYHTIYKKNGHFYYLFPLGTPLASFPFVALANSLGFNMQESESMIQIAIASFTAVLILIYLIKTARLFVGPINAILISSVFWFGTSFASTSGTALWSHNFASLCALVAVYIVIKMTKENNTRYWPIISIFLFAAYFCRPTMALLSIFVLSYLFTYNRLLMVKVAALQTLLFLGFVWFSWCEFGQVLPDYYLPQRLSGGHFIEAFYGNLFSPARGLLIYSPFILLVWLCFHSSLKDWGIKKSWLFIGICWPIVHLITISRFPHWWAGWSYGARFMTDVLPGLFLLTLYAWPTNAKSVLGKVTIGFLIVASIFAIFVNSGQGLFNKYTPIWCAEPNIDKYPVYLFDWGYPQFLASEKGHLERLIKHSINHLPVINPSVEILHTSENIFFLGWSGAEDKHRWSLGKFSSIIFVIDKRDKYSGKIVIDVGTLGKQRVKILINQVEVYYGEINSWDQIITVDFEPTLLLNGQNIISFDIPDARQPNTIDTRVLALAIRSFSIQ